MFKSDMLGHKMMDIMMEKARQGVEVRFLFDAAGSLKLAGKDIKKLKRAGVNIVPFLPLKYGFFNQKFNFRNHRKIVIVDGKVGFVGGLNVGKEYIGKDQDVGFWRDTHMKVEGEIVQTLHSIFMLDWEYVSDEVLIDQKAYTRYGCGRKRLRLSSRSDRPRYEGADERSVLRHDSGGRIVCMDRDALFRAE